MQLPFKKVTAAVGWYLALATTLGFFLYSQWMLFDRGQLILGIYALLTCLLLMYWLSWRPERALSLTKVLLFAAVLVVFHAVARWASVRYGVMTDAKFYILAAVLVLVFTIHSPFSSSPPERYAAVPDQRVQRAIGWMLALTALFAVIIVLAKKYLAPYDYTNVINFFFVLRSDGIVGDIPSQPFTAWWKLWLPLLYLGLLVGSYWFILYRQERVGVWKSLLLIYILGNLGGLSLVYLSSNGWADLMLQVKSVHFNWYNVAKEFPSFSAVWHMLGTYAHKELFRWYSFPMSHPPLFVVWNWILIHVTGDNPTLIAILLGAGAWTGVFPMFLIGREMYNRELGYYMAGLYSVLPNTLIINHIALDGVIAAFMAWSVALVLMGSRREKHGYMFLAGLAVAGFALTHYSTPIILPALFVLAVFGLRSLGKPAQGAAAWLTAAGVKTLVFVAGFALPFLAVELATGWKFDYLGMQRFVLFSAYNNSIALHPWFVGSWLGWVNYLAFVGVPVLALFIIRWLDILRGDWKNDTLPWAGIIIMLIPFALGAIRQETERAFMLLNVLVVATAVVVLWRDQRPLRFMLRAQDEAAVESMGGGWREMFLAILALSFINAMIIEMLVVDHF